MAAIQAVTLVINITRRARVTIRPIEDFAFTREPIRIGGVKTNMARAHNPHVWRAKSRPQFVRLGTWQFVVMMAGVALVLTAAGLADYPSAYRRYLQDFGIKKFETEFGFRTGLVEWQEPGKARALTWGVVAVAPNGAFARAGVRDGDIPLAFHDRVTELYVTLEQASSGQVASFEVLNSAEAALGYTARRQIRVEARRTHTDH